MKNIVVTEICEMISVFSEKGICEKMDNRKCYGMSFSMDGQITYIHNGKEYVSDNKHIVILPEGESYVIKRDKTGVFPVINFKCKDFLTDTFLLFPVENMDAFIMDFKRMQELFLFPENHAKIMSIFYEMLHNILNKRTNCKTLEPAIFYIEKNYMDATLTNEDLAKVCKISEIYLRKLFRTHFKTTPKQYVAEIRLQKAKQLLSEGSLKINAIAEKCGFASQYHFSRFFREKTGLSPSKFMAENKTIVI